MENFGNKSGLMGCKWSSLDAPGTGNPLLGPYVELGAFPIPIDPRGRSDAGSCVFHVTLPIILVMLNNILSIKHKMTSLLPEDSHQADDVGALGGIRRGHEPYRQQDDWGQDGEDQSPVILQ